MTRHTTWALIAIVLVSIGSARAQEIDTKAAQAAAEAWLSLVDNETYAESWTTAATGFRNAITSERWQAAVANARRPMGKLKERSLDKATTARTLPGAPDGEYVVFQFNTAFENKAAAVETVTAAKDTDGMWRIAGYFVK
jgi:hypothetical protein